MGLNLVIKPLCWEKEVILFSCASWGPYLKLYYICLVESLVWVYLVFIIIIIEHIFFLYFRKNNFFPH